MVMLYRLGRWTWLLARLMVRLPYVSLVNLVLGKKVIPELLQSDASPRRIAAEAEQILMDDGERERMRAGLAELRARLGEEEPASARRARSRRSSVRCLGFEAAHVFWNYLRRYTGWAMLAAVGILVYATAQAATGALLQPIFGEVLLAKNQVSTPFGSLASPAPSSQGDPQAPAAGKAAGKADDASQRPRLVREIRKRLNLQGQFDRSYQSLKNRMGVEGTRWSTSSPCSS